MTPDDTWAHPSVLAAICTAMASVTVGIMLYSANRKAAAAGEKRAAAEQVGSEKTQLDRLGVVSQIQENRALLVHLAEQISKLVSLQENTHAYIRDALADLNRSSRAVDRLCATIEKAGLRCYVEEENNP